MPVAAGRAARCDTMPAVAPNLTLMGRSLAISKVGSPPRTGSNTRRLIRRYPCSTRKRCRPTFFDEEERNPGEGGEGGGVTRRWHRLCRLCLHPRVTASKVSVGEPPLELLARRASARVGHQPEGRGKPRHHDPAVAAAARRRGDPVGAATAVPVASACQTLLCLRARRPTAPRATC